MLAIDASVPLNHLLGDIERAASGRVTLLFQAAFDSGCSSNSFSRLN